MFLFFNFSGCVQSQIKPALNKLGEDSDFDVRFFASEAMTGNFFLIRVWPGLQNFQ